jgi:hypothetical protein
MKHLLKLGEILKNPDLDHAEAAVIETSSDGKTDVHWVPRDFTYAGITNFKWRLRSPLLTVLTCGVE